MFLTCSRLEANLISETPRLIHSGLIEGISFGRKYNDCIFAVLKSNFLLKESKSEPATLNNLSVNNFMNSPFTPIFSMIISHKSETDNPKFISDVMIEQTKVFSCDC